MFAIKRVFAAPPGKTSGFADLFRTFSYKSLKACCFGPKQKTSEHNHKREKRKETQNPKAKVEKREAKTEKRNVSFFFFFFFFFFWVESRLGLLLCWCLSSYYSLTTDPGRALDIKLAPIAPIQANRANGGL